MEKFELVCREWITAYCRTITPILDLPEEAQLESVSIELGPPYSGTSVLHIRSSSGQRTDIVLCDAFPPFGRILEWLERLCGPGSCCATSQDNLRLDSYSHTYTLAVTRVGIQKKAGQEDILCPVSLVTVHRSDEFGMTFGCFCRTDDFIAEFYRAVRHSISKYSALYNRPERWRTERDYRGRHLKSYSETLMCRFRSKNIEGLISYDKSCQNRFLPLRCQDDNDMEYWEFYGDPSDVDDEIQF